MAPLDIDRARAAWWVLGGLLALVLAWVLQSYLGTFVFGVFFYYATRPVYRRVNREVPSRSLAALLSLFLVALPILLLLGYAVAIALQEFGRFAANTDLGPYASVLGPYIDLSKVIQRPSELFTDPDLRDAVRPVLDGAIQYTGIVANGLLHAFVMFALAFYLLRDGPKLARWTTARFDDDRGVFTTYARAVDDDLYKVFSGNILNAVVTAAIGAIVFSLLNAVAPEGQGIPYPALLGLLAGAASLIPIVGMKLVYIPVAAYLFVAASTIGGTYWFPALFAGVSFLIVDTIPDLVLRPYVSGRNLHVGMVMLAYIFGPLLFGWYGIFLGPILLVLVVHFARVVLPELLAGEPIRPYTVDPTYISSDPAPAPPGADPED